MWLHFVLFLWVRAAVSQLWWEFEETKFCVITEGERDRETTWVTSNSWAHTSGNQNATPPFSASLRTTLGSFTFFFSSPSGASELSLLASDHQETERKIIFHLPTFVRIWCLIDAGRNRLLNPKCIAKLIHNTMRFSTATLQHLGHKFIIMNKS